LEASSPWRRDRREIEDGRRASIATGVGIGKEMRHAFHRIKSRHLDTFSAGAQPYRLGRTVKEFPIDRGERSVRVCGKQGLALAIEARFAGCPQRLPGFVRWRIVRD